MEDTFKMCDRVLEYMLTNKNVICTTDRDVQVSFKNEHLQLQQALSQLKIETPPLVIQYKDTESYTMTGDGERFARMGGYKNKLERLEKEKIERLEDREYARNVSKSVLDTNNATKKLYGFQKWATIGTIAVAIASVIISCFSLFIQRDEMSKQSLIQDRLNQLERRQLSIDTTINTLSHIGHAYEKHP
jgi:uncharacterized membrane protein YukC